MRKEISGGVYLVLDVRLPEGQILEKLEAVLPAGPAAVQLWGKLAANDEMILRIQRITTLCHAHTVPVFINNNFELLNFCEADGVHFDDVPHDFGLIKTGVKRAFRFGVTCGNDLSVLRRADENGADYISFCAMFPTETVSSCDIVMPETVRKARSLTRLPVFISGGMTPGNTARLKQQIPFDGVAIVSGIWKASDPKREIERYQVALNQPENEKRND